MSCQRPEDLSERCFDFACDVYDYCEDLIRLGGLAARLAYQLWDAASSVGANRAEAKSSYSAREFAAKTAISLKEVRESHFWLRIADAKRLGNPGTRRRLLDESNQLVAIFTTSLRQLQDKLHR